MWWPAALFTHTAWDEQELVTWSSNLPVSQSDSQANTCLPCFPANLLAAEVGCFLLGRRPSVRINRHEEETA